MPLDPETFGDPLTTERLYVRLCGNQCPAEARTGNARKVSATSTYRCQRVAGHEGGHCWRDDGVRTITWYGEAKKQEDDTRWRYGFVPGHDGGTTR